MSISLGLVYGLAILLPGFFFYGAIFVSSSGKGLSTSSPSPNSVLTIFLIGFGAIIGHLIGAAFVVINRIFSEKVFSLDTSFNPDFYDTLLNLSQSKTDDLGAALIFLLALSFVAFAAGKVLQVFLPSLFQDIKFGTYSHIVSDSQDDNEVVIAYVLTKETVYGSSRKQNDMLGYEGIVANLVHDKIGVNGIHLRGAVPFKLCKLGAGLKRRSYGGEVDPIPHLYIPNAEILNLAVEIIKIDTSE